MCYYLTNICCLCLSGPNEVSYCLKSASEDNVTYYEKLNTSLSALVINGKHDDYMLCLQCCASIDSLYEFRKRCLKNLSSFSEYKSKLSVLNDERCDLIIKVTDIKVNEVDCEKIIQNYSNLEQQSEVMIDNSASEIQLLPSVSEGTFEHLNSRSCKEIIKEENKSTDQKYVVCESETPYNCERTFHPDRDDDRKPCDGSEWGGDICSDAAQLGSVKHEQEMADYDDALVYGGVSENELGDYEMKIEEQDIKSEFFGSEANVFVDVSRCGEVKEIDDNGGLADPLNVSEPACVKSDKREATDKSPQTAQKHVHTAEKPHVCDVCNEGFSRLSSLAIHKLIHAEKRPHVSDEGCSKMGNLNDHKLIHTRKRSHVCDVCDKAFCRLSHLNRHKLIHTGKKSHVCDVCDKAFFRLSNLNTHKLIHTGKKSHECDVCDKAFFRLNHLNRHKLIHTAKKSHVCDVCDKAFFFLDNLNRHKLVHTEEKPHVCDVCAKAFFRSSHLNAHKLIHTEKKSHVCNVCDKAFFTLGNLNRHKLIHTGEKPHVCAVCAEAFSTLSKMNNHKFIHTGKRSHVCDVCDKAFVKLCHLHTHKLIHTGEKPHVCDTCAKAFSAVSTLNAHKLIHTGERPHVCDVCDKAFYSLGLLNRHKLIHTGKKSHVCDLCDKAFSQLSVLKTHKLIHTGEKSHVCDVCDKAFTQSRYLKSHKLAHTSKRTHGIHRGGFVQSDGPTWHKRVHTGIKPHD